MVVLILELIPFFSVMMFVFVFVFLCFYYTDLRSQQEHWKFWHFIYYCSVTFDPGVLACGSAHHLISGTFPQSVTLGGRLLQQLRTVCYAIVGWLSHRSFQK